MNRIVRYFGQAAWYAGIAAALGYFGTGPVYTHFRDDQAQIRLSFAHGAKREAADCRRRTADELAKLPHRERVLYACERKRVPVYVELYIDNQLRISKTVRAGGVGSDSPARVYEKFVLSPGQHSIVARLRDSDRAEGFDYEKRAEVTLNPRQNLVIDFRAAEGGFIIQ